MTNFLCPPQTVFCVRYNSALHTDLMGIAHGMAAVGARSKPEAKFDSSVANISTVIERQ